jgi:hypothetical protein
MRRNVVGGAALAAALSALLPGCEIRTEPRDRATASANEGAACVPGTGGCAGPNAAFVCVDGKLVRRACTGPAGCVEERAGEAVEVVCAWEAGARCGVSEEGKGSCSPDGKVLLECRGGEVRPKPCRGADGCKAAAGMVQCDGSIAQIGDPCDPKLGAACSSDGLALLECKEGKLVQTLKCGGPTKCAVTAGAVHCDSQIGAVGDVCVREDAWACSEDRKHRLACKGGKLAIDHTCPKPCVVDDGFVVCH